MTKLTQRLTQLEGISLTPWMQGMVTAIANGQNLDPPTVMQETKSILRQVHEAGIPLNEAAVTAFLASPTRPGGATW